MVQEKLQLISVHKMGHLGEWIPIPWYLQANQHMERGAKQTTWKNSTYLSLKIQVFKGGMSFAFGGYVQILIATWYLAVTLKANYAADFLGEGKWPAQIPNYLRAYSPYHWQRSYFIHEQRDFALSMVISTSSKPLSMCFALGAFSIHGVNQPWHSQHW